MNRNRTPSKKSQKENIDDEKCTVKELSALVEQVNNLKHEEAELDKQLADMDRKGVKSSDSTLIMDAFHEYNETRDALGNVFEFLGSIGQSTCADLHKKYNVPLE